MLRLLQHVDATPVFASDFGPMVTGAFLLLGLVVLTALLMGIVTSLVLFVIYRWKGHWLLAPVYGLGWLAVIAAMWFLWVEVLRISPHREPEPRQFQHQYDNPDIDSEPVHLPEG